MMTRGTEAEFKAAAMLLERLWFVEPQWVDAETRGIDWTAIVKAELGMTISDGEQIILEAARLAWSGREAPSLLARAMRTLDDSNWAAFLQALETRRPIRVTR